MSLKNTPKEIEKEVSLYLVETSFYHFVTIKRKTYIHMKHSA